MAKYRRSCTWFLCSKRIYRMIICLLAMTLIVSISYNVSLQLAQSSPSFKEHEQGFIHRLPPRVLEVKHSNNNSVSVNSTYSGRAGQSNHQIGSYQSLHAGFDTYSLPRLMSCQKPPNQALVVDKRVNVRDMTVPKCMRFCQKKTVFVALVNGSDCYCMDAHGTNYLTPDSECNVPCRGNNSTMCGGTEQWLFYKIGDADGIRGWTPWMSYGRSKNNTNLYRTRYRGCIGDKHVKRDCLVKLEVSGSAVKTKDNWMIKKHFIGCFTHQTWELANNSLVITNDSTVNTNEGCINFCNNTKSTYSILNIDNCICANSLGWSQPVDTCIYGVGSLVFSTLQIQKSKITLQFEGRLTKRRVAVIAHYRGGSTFASLMFSEYPNSLYIFEPASVFGIVWKGVNMSLANEAGRSRTFLERLYPLWFYCNGRDLPGVWLYRYPGWGLHNQGLSVYNKCKKAIRSPAGGLLCSAYIEEKCLMAPIVAAKTTRMLHAENLRRFTRMGTNIDIIHVFRDPRGTLQSRAHLERYYRTDQVNHLTIACWELNQLATVFDEPNRPPHIHSMHYEHMAADIISSAKKIFRELNMTLPAVLVDKLRVAVGQGNQTEADSPGNYGTIKSNPLSKIHSWVKKLNNSTVEMADQSSECRRLYATYPEVYKPFKDLKNYTN